MTSEEQIKITKELREKVIEFAKTLYDDPDYPNELAVAVSETPGWYDTKNGLKVIAKGNLKQAEEDYKKIIEFAETLPNDLTDRWD